jgi:hypothetical protein
MGQFDAANSLGDPYQTQGWKIDFFPIPRQICVLSYIVLITRVFKSTNVMLEISRREKFLNLLQTDFSFFFAVPHLHID